MQKASFKVPLRVLSQTKVASRDREWWVSQGSQEIKKLSELYSEKNCDSGYWPRNRLETNGPETDQVFEAIILWSEAWLPKACDWLRFTVPLPTYTSSKLGQLYNLKGGHTSQHLLPMWLRGKLTGKVLLEGKAGSGEDGDEAWFQTAKLRWPVDFLISLPGQVAQESSLSKSMCFLNSDSESYV